MGERTLAELLKAYWNIAYGFGASTDRAAYARETGDELDAIHAEIIARFIEMPTAETRGDIRHKIADKRDYQFRNAFLMALWEYDDALCATPPASSSDEGSD